MDLEQLEVGIEWVVLAQDGDMWRAFVIAVMYLRFT
jgi:hypothetical protein